MKHTLILTRNVDEDAILRDNAAGAGTITLDKISWYMPHVYPADMERMELHKIIERKEKIPFGYKYIQCDSITVPQSIGFTWRLSVKSSPEVPRFIIVGFQTDKSGNQEQNLSIFDNVTIFTLC